MTEAQESHYCGRGICAAMEGHEGTCAEASGWDSVDPPRRVQLSRRKGWRKPENTVVVSRPSKWGNPYVAAHYVLDWPESDEYERRRMAASDFRGLLEGRWGEDGDYPPLSEIRAALAGKNLACWCPLDHPCHADVLLEIANPDTPKRIE